MIVFRVIHVDVRIRRAFHIPLLQGFPEHVPERVQRSIRIDQVVAIPDERSFRLGCMYPDIVTSIVC